MCQVKYPGCKTLKDAYPSWNIYCKHVNVLDGQSQEKIYYYHCSDCGVVEGLPRTKRFSNPGKGSFASSAGSEYYCRICDSYIGREFTKRS